MTLAEYLAEVKRRAEAATPGLVPVGKSEGIFIEDGNRKHVALFSGTNLVNDSNFYEHARTDIPLLLAIIEEQARLRRGIAGEYADSTQGPSETLGKIAMHTEDCDARIDALIAKGEK